MTFESAVDGFFYMAFLLAWLLVSAIGYFALKQVGNAMLIPVLVPALPVFGLPVWLLFSTSYTITDTELLVRSGPVDRRVALNEITGITPTRSARSSPGLSLDRLEVRYGEQGSILVSPKDKTGFAAALGYPLSQEQEVEQ
jgi:hypothetical protein